MPVIVLLPIEANVSEQLPTPELRVAVQVSPVFALTRTLPVGVPFALVTLTEMSMGCEAVVALGVTDVIAVALAAFKALTLWVTVEAAA